jgi:hypothetical protein
VNAEGDFQSYYSFKFPFDQPIKVYLPAGTPPEIGFSELAIASTPPSDPSYPSLIALINTLFAANDFFPAGGTVGQVLAIAQESPRVLEWANSDVSHPFSYGDATPTAIAVANKVSTIKIMLLNAFNGADPSLKIGDATVSDRLFPANKINLKKASTWVFHPQVQYAPEEEILLEIVASGSTAGNGVVFLEY